MDTQMQSGGAGTLRRLLFILYLFQRYELAPSATAATVRSTATATVRSTATAMRSTAAAARS
jgi:hypothetical protein